MKTVRINDCKGLVIRYGRSITPYGRALVAATDQGLCYLGFDTDITCLEKRFKGATLTEAEAESFNYNTLVLYGTDFQVSVWQELLRIPLGKTRSYGEIAERVGRPTAQRAVGTAVGSNPISLIIPCHRVLAAGGKIGGFLWGTDMKKRILADEKRQAESKPTGIDIGL